MTWQGEDEVVPYVAMRRPESIPERLYGLVPSGSKLLCNTAELLRRVFVPQVIAIVVGAAVGASSAGR